MLFDKQITLFKHSYILMETLEMREKNAGKIRGFISHP